MLKTNELNADNSTRMDLDKINMFLDTYAPLKRIIKYKLKFKSKPCAYKNQYLWKTNSLKISLTTKNIETYSPLLWRKVNRLIMTNILKEIGITLRTNGKELNS